MPGVPPDAFAQVKKGLKAIFRRKAKKAHANEEAPPASTTTALGPADPEPEPAPVAALTPADLIGPAAGARRPSVVRFADPISIGRDEPVAPAVAPEATPAQPATAAGETEPSAQ